MSRELGVIAAARPTASKAEKSSTHRTVQNLSRNAKLLTCFAGVSRGGIRQGGAGPWGGVHLIGVALLRGSQARPENAWCGAAINHSNDAVRKLLVSRLSKQQDLAHAGE